MYGFEDVFRALGYEPEDIFSNIDKTTFDGEKTTYNGNAQNNANSPNSYNLDDESEGKGSGAGGWNPFTGFKPNCNDVFNGFQTLNPEVFNIIGEILADVVAGRIPFNVQNALGNWIQLVGQIIETYSAQQNYFQSGPGRFYNLKYYNVANPFVPSNEQETNSSQSSVSSNNITSENQLDDIRKTIEELRKDIRHIDERIDNIENLNNNHNS